MSKHYTVFSITLLTLLMISCGSKKNAITIVGPEGITLNIRNGNLNSRVYPWSYVGGVGNNVADGKLKRWDISGDGLIPVKLNGSAVATQALDEIESKLGITIFNRTSIANTADSNVTRGLIVSEGTAWDGSGTVTANTCGHVSGTTTDGRFPDEYMDTSGKISARIYVNIGSSACPPRVDIAIHEFAHALAFGPHFSGFGIDGVYNDNLWNALATVYSNPIGTAESAISVKQIIF
jgi:hypothetical protein